MEKSAPKARALKTAKKTSPGIKKTAKTKSAKKSSPAISSAPGKAKPKAASSSKRGITAEEYHFALSIFQREFPPRDEITISTGTGLGGRPFVRPTIDGEILMNLGSVANNTLGTISNKALFAHELTHAWQIEHYGLLWYGKEALSNQVISDDAYSYTCDATKTLGDYNAEQMGEIVKNSVLGKSCEKQIVEKTLFSNTWKLLIGSDAVDMAVDTDGTYYMVNTKGFIYRYNGFDWEKLSGSNGRAIAASGGKVVLVNSAGFIYEKTGSLWKKLPGSDAVDVAVAGDGTVWMVNTVGKIYTFLSGRWKQMAGSAGRKISSGGGRTLLVNSVGKIYEYNAGSAKWTQLSGSAGKDVTVSNDGQIFLTNTVGKIYQRNGAAWTQLDGSDGVRVSANRGKLVLVNTKGRMYYRLY